MSLLDIISMLLFGALAIYQLRPFGEKEYQRAMQARDRAYKRARQESRNQNLEFI